MNAISKEHIFLALAHCPFLTHREKWSYTVEVFPECAKYTHLKGSGYHLSHNLKKRFEQYSNDFSVSKVMKEYKEAKVYYVTLASEDYPFLLRNTYEPPMVLFCKGDYSLIYQPLIGLVGARECTAYGHKVLDHLLPSIIDRRLVTVSGLAKGIDTVVHAKTIENGGKTIAVIGNGIGYVYPKENKGLQEDIAEKHLLLSEYPLNTPPKKHHFPLRNRIIAGLSRGIIVVEAKKRSGSLITARLALEEGRDVFAVPGSIFSELSEGCLDLIQSGAISCRKSQDIFTEWNMDL